MQQLRPRHPAGTKHITRCDYRRTHGYWVRISRKVDGERKLTSRLFSDSKFGGKDKALRAAVEWRDKKVAVLPATKKRERQPGGGYVRKVRRSRRSAKTGKVTHYFAWVAWIRLANGEAASTNWSINKWGTDAARSKARQWLRKKRIAEGLPL